MSRGSSLELIQQATPSRTPATGYTLFYVKADGMLYAKNGSTETLIGPSAGGTDGQPMGLTGATTATRYVGGTTGNLAPTTGTFAKGDFVIADTGVVYVCTVAGSPGTWVGMYSDGNPPETLMHEQRTGAPATPGAGLGTTYMNSGRLYFINSSGAITELTTTDASTLSAGTLPDGRLPGRLAASALSNVTTDWNTALDSGWYRSATGGATNGPTTNACIGTVARWSAGYTQQQLMDVTTEIMYQRNYNNSVWGAWKTQQLGQVAQDARYLKVPEEYTIFHLGLTTTYTVTPLTAATTEPANQPMARLLVNLSNVTTFRLIIGLRVIGLGATSCQARLEYATNGATQTTWADASTGTGNTSLMGGTANLLRTNGWFSLAAGAIADDVYLRLVIATVGTLTTAPTIASAKVQFR